MRCAEIGPILSDYADGIADERGRRIVERHIQLCSACRDSMLVARQLGQQLKRLPLLPSGVNARAPSMRRRLEHKLARSRRRRFPALMARTTFALGIAVLLVWLLFAVLLA